MGDFDRAAIVATVRGRVVLKGRPEIGSFGNGGGDCRPLGPPHAKSQPKSQQGRSKEGVQWIRFLKSKMSFRLR
jgi:hypothetical protein